MIATGDVSGVAERVFVAGVDLGGVSGIVIVGLGVMTFDDAGLMSSSIGSTEVSLLASLMVWS